MTNRAETYFFLISISIIFLYCVITFDVISLLSTKEHEPIALALDNIQLLSVPIEAMHTWLTNYPDFNHNLMPYLA